MSGCNMLMWEDALREKGSFPLECKRIQVEQWIGGIRLGYKCIVVE